MTKSRDHMIDSNLYIIPPPSGCLFVSSLQLMSDVVRFVTVTLNSDYRNIKDKSFSSHSTEEDDAKCPLSAPMCLTDRINCTEFITEPQKDTSGALQKGWVN